MKFIYLSFLLALLLVPNNIIYAQDMSGIAYEVSIVGPKEEIQDGSVIVFTDGEYKLSEEANDNNIVGVVDLNPSLSFRKPNLENVYPVIYTGSADVLVNEENGPVVKGDKITSSSIKGQAMKANQDSPILGEVLGVSDKSEGSYMVLTNLSNIKRNINKDYENYNMEPGVAGFISKLKDVFTLSKQASSESPSKVFKNVVAATVVLLSILFTFLTVGKTARNGIEAFGRNPLAAKLISVGLVFNVIIAVFILATGLLVAYFIIKV